MDEFYVGGDDFVHQEFRHVAAQLIPYLRMLKMTFPKSRGNLEEILAECTQGGPKVLEGI